MERAPTALHRVLAWCAAVLFFVLVAFGTRTAVRALAPEPAPEPEPEVRVDATLVDVEAARPASEPQHAPEAEPQGARASPTSGARREGLFAPGREPMEQHPYFVIEGSVRSASGLFRKKVVLDVVHPGGGVATKELFFDRRAPDGSGWSGRYKLIKPAEGSYVLRPRQMEGWPYRIVPEELVVSDSAQDVDFLVLDDVEHVDLDVVVLGSQGLELDVASCAVCTPEVMERCWSFGSLPNFELDQGPELTRVPVGLTLEWLATAPGYRPSRGAFDVLPGQERCEVRLEPGWGAYLVDMARKSDPQVGEVWMDGRYAGLTDPSGITFVTADAPPRELRLWFGDHWAFDMHERQVDDWQLSYLWARRTEQLDALPPPGN